MDDRAFLKDFRQWPFHDQALKQSACCLKGKSFAIASVDWLSAAIDGDHTRIVVREDGNSTPFLLTADEIVDQGWVVD